MPLLTLNLLEPPPRLPCTQLPPAPFRLGSTKVSRGHWPARGLVYSFLVHEIAIFSLLLFPSFDKFRKPVTVPDQLLAIDLNTPARLLYFPELNKRESESPRSKGKESASNDEAEKTVEPTKGLT